MYDHKAKASSVEKTMYKSLLNYLIEGFRIEINEKILGIVSEELKILICSIHNVYHIEQIRTNV